MPLKLYLETSIVSYLTSRPSRDLVIAARQELTHALWPVLASRFEVYISALVMQEAARGDPEAAASRLRALEGFPLLDLADAARALADALIVQGAIAATSPEDALHLAVAATNGMDFLLTWNYRHLNNVFLRARIRAVVERQGYLCPELCTPEELEGLSP